MSAIRLADKLRKQVTEKMQEHHAQMDKGQSSDRYNHPLPGPLDTLPHPVKTTGYLFGDCARLPGHLFKATAHIGSVRPESGNDII